MYEAWQSLERAHVLLKGLTVEPDNRLGWFHTLAAVHAARAEFFIGSQQISNALTALESALELVGELRRAEPDNQRFRQDEQEIKQQITALRGEPG
jgi:hypothetical protein